MTLVNADFRRALKRFIRESGDIPWSARTLAKLREPASTISRSSSPIVRSRLIPGPPGSPDVSVFVIGKIQAKVRRPAILHIHGGGFVAGSAESRIPDLQRIASEHDCVIVSVDYRLAPETRFPGSLEDNYAALKFLYDSAQTLGVDPARIAVMGESAGGGHAAMLAIAARDRGEVPIAFQLLIYPMLDDRTGSVLQLPPYIGTYVWVPASNQFGWTSLLGLPAGSPTVPVGAVPARVENLTGLPPTFIGVGSIDLFIDEDLEYARRLILSGVSTQLCVVSGGFHGFDLIAPDASTSKEFRITWNTALAKAFKMKSPA